ncbi:MAG TPA: hypothetical protein VGI81_15070 [Tepidisphaeraceae bacterium]|jgi:hypothetical protein
MRQLPFVVASLLVLFSVSGAWAAGFAAELNVTEGKAAQLAKSVASHDSRPGSHRITLEASVNGAFTAKWNVTRTDPAEAKDVLVHFYVVKLDRPGQAPPALDPAKVAIESALTMDFAQGRTSNAAQQFRLEEPGVYLVRIEAGGDPDKPGQADYAEIELSVK